MSLGELNKGTIALILFLLVGAGGYLWFSQLYKPAVAARTTAQAAADTAQQGLTAAKAELDTAQKTLASNNDAAKKENDAVARLQLARQTVPDKVLLDDAVLVLSSIGDRSGISAVVDVKDAGPDLAAASSSLDGARAIDLEFEAAGTVPELLDFMRRVEGTVEVKKSKIYPTGRLFNVVSLKIDKSEDKDEAAAGGSADFGMTGEAEQAKEGPIVGKNDLLFTIVIRMYTSSTENSQAAGAAADATAAPTDGAAATADPNAAAAAGAATTPGATVTPDAANAVPASTSPTPDPNATAGGATSGTATTPGATTPAPAGGI